MFLLGTHSWRVQYVRGGEVVDLDARPGRDRPAAADDAKRPPPLDAKRNIIHRLHNTFLGVEVRAQVFNV